MPFQLHICRTVVREILMGAYIRKRRPLEIEITFKQKIVCSWEQSAMHTVRRSHVTHSWA